MAIFPETGPVDSLRIGPQKSSDMVHEYAIEPDALITWEALRFFEGKLGCGHGRLVAKYPSKWLHLVWERCAETSTRKRLMFQETLARIGDRVIKTGRKYDDQDDWLTNARRVHLAQPFHAIIAIKPGDEPHILCAEEITEETPRWAVLAGGTIPRTSEGLAELSRPLLEISTNVRFVDQYFSCAARHGRPLVAMLEHAFSGRAPSSVEYHLNANGTGDWFRGELEGIRRRLDLAGDASISFVRWRRVEGGENMHARYILTNRGGIRIDYGLDTGEPGETSDWNLLDEATREQRFKQFEKGARVFELVDAWRVTAAGVSAIQW